MDDPELEISEEHDLFDWITFEDDESVLWKGKPHRYSLIPAFLIGIPLAILVIGLLIIAWAWIDRENTTYVITNKAVYRKRGAISRDVKRVSFEKIQNTSLKQGIFGTYFEYGNVEISTAGSEGAEVTFRAVAEPRSVQQQVNGRLEKVRTESEDVRAHHSADDEEITILLRDILAEVKAIRESVTSDDSKTE